ncbi:methylated-DNA--[protein]-cysteine S-methyltransferase [Gemella cuniculi]|uniref:methylated-DNA--[protein]-cysteine S-methyltransferase n=1 Tax=Gemella cuniculi TaxID=150240 RepID=UPI000411D816|nr:methylated-DNA--[protein]-cysteine S-methyltransferase [Gemella cuniculi]
MYYSKYSSPIGIIILTSDGINLVGSYLENQKYFLSNIENFERHDDLKTLKDSKKWLDMYFSGKNPSLKGINLKLSGTSFRKEVWEILKEIPYSKTVTYKEIAQRICKIRDIKNMSPQAVGGAISHNPLFIFIPCHRVVGSDGKLTGFAAGIDKKLFLLNLERRSSFKI